MALGVEIERKWLLDIHHIEVDLSKAKQQKLEQAYISTSPTIRIRKSNDGECILCVKNKIKSSTFARQEFETRITVTQYDALLKKTEGNVVQKTRYTLQTEDGHKLEIDIFEGSLAPLAYLEIEFASEAEAAAFEPPKWVGRDVSCDKRYRNTALAQLGIPDKLI